MNPLYQNQQNQMIENIQKQAIQLKKEVQNPQQLVQQMLNDGRISQQAFNQAFPFAQALAAKMPKL